MVGGGYIGLELGTAFAKMGAKVTVVEALPRILPLYDAELTRPVAKRLGELGVEVLTGAKAKGLSTQGRRAAGRRPPTARTHKHRGRQGAGDGRAQAADRRLGPRGTGARHGRQIHPHRRPVPHLDARRLRDRRRHRRADAGPPRHGAGRDGGRDRRRPQAQLGQALHPGRSASPIRKWCRPACRRRRPKTVAARSRSACSRSRPMAAP